MAGLLGSLIGNDNLEIESNRIGWERVKATREAIFVIIESGVVIGALKAGFLKTQSDQLVILYIFAFGALALYIMVGANYLTALLFSYYGWSGRQVWARRAFRLMTFVISMSVPYFVQSITSDLILQVLK